jgi:hypothetical protein
VRLLALASSLSVVLPASSTSRCSITKGDRDLARVRVTRQGAARGARERARRGRARRMTHAHAAAGRRRRW